MICQNFMTSSGHRSSVRPFGGTISVISFGRELVKSAVFGLALIGAVVNVSAAFAGSADDAKWIAQCIMDNKDEKVAAEVMTKYCTCMTAKMDENETKSVTQWEKTHKTEEAQCDKESGWK
jgi:hypothetical protein